MSRLAREACDFVSQALADAADPEKARGMQAYMKTDMPFHGVQKPGRGIILRRLNAQFVPRGQEEYEGLILALWDMPHREEKYIAIGAARHHHRYVVPESLPLYRRLIVEGGWWDLVDEVATHLIRDLVVQYPIAAWAEVDTWIDHHDLWLRRSAIICQVGARDHLDQPRLFGFCSQRAHENEFFIRKAIGWALRDHARTDPEAVARFVLKHRESLSGLSFREATKHISHLVRE